MERKKGPPIELVNALGSELDAVLGADLVGLYLYGSSVAGGFEPGISDVDLVAVSASELAASVQVALERMDERVGDRFPEWRDRIEVVYVSRATLGSFRTPHSCAGSPEAGSASPLRPHAHRPRRSSA